MTLGIGKSSRRYRRTVPVLLEEPFVRLSVQSAHVGSTLTDFPVSILMENLPAEFWNIVAADGGNIRAYDSDGMTQLPMDFLKIVPANNVGLMFVKKTLSSSQNTDIILKFNGSGLLAESDPLSTQDVWSDYAAVLAGSGSNDRTGNDVLVDKIGTGGSIEDIYRNMNDVRWDLNSTETETSDAFTIGFLHKTSTNLSSQTWIYWEESTSNRVAIGLRTSSTPDRISAWDPTNNWVTHQSDTVPAVDTTYHGALRYNGTTGRDFFVNGVKDGSDTGISAMLTGSLPANFYVGDHGTGPIGTSRGMNRLAYLRKEVLSDDWLEAEYQNQVNPSSFYTATFVGP